MKRVALALFTVIFVLQGIAPAAAQQQQGRVTAPDFGVPSDFYGQEEEEEAPPEIINQYSDKYKKKPRVVQGAPTVLPPRLFQIQFVRTPQTGPTEATLRVLSPFTVSGCAAISPPVVSQEIKGHTIWYAVSDPGVELQRAPGQEIHSCRQKANYAFTDITFNRDFLMEQGITQIAFKAGTQVDYYDIAVGEDRLSLMPKSMNAFKPKINPQFADGLTQWFYPENMVVLYVPGAGGQENMFEKVKTAAQSMGMIDAEAALPGFRQPMLAQNNFYFVDESGQHAAGLGAEESRLVGSVEIGETFYGPNGPYLRPKSLDIYMRRPGLEN